MPLSGIGHKLRRSARGRNFMPCLNIALALPHKTIARKLLMRLTQRIDKVIRATGGNSGHIGGSSGLSDLRLRRSLLGCSPPA